MKRGQLLGGAAPKRRVWRGGRRMEAGRETSGVVSLLAFIVFLLALLGGFGFSLDRQLRGGLLTQREVAQERGDWLVLGELPPHVPLAILVVVDPAFLKRLPTEIGVESTTLSRDLVRQVHHLSANLGGEARELMMGSLLEARLTDAELLELYLNRVQLGADAEWDVIGVYHAALEYFGKEAAHLTAGEAATLAGFLLPPRISEPRQQVGAVGIRRNEVLAQMLAVGAITNEEHATAVQEPLGFQFGPEYEPMTRPSGWDRPPEVIRLPPELVFPSDTLP